MTGVDASPRGWATSPAQRRLWVVNQMLEGAAASAYNMPIALRLTGFLDVGALRGAFDALIARHESLRTTFGSLDGEPLQFVHANPRATLKEIDLTGSPNNEQLARELVAKEEASPFDLASGPLLRTTLIGLTANEHILVFNIHHIVCDEWSLGVLVQEISAFYENTANGREAPLGQLRIQYKDYAAWQNATLESEEMREHRDYWQNKLAGSVPALNLPADYPRPAVKSYDARAFTIQLNGSLIADLKRLSAGRRTTLFTALVAIVKILLYRYTGQEDIVIGCPVAGRDHQDLQNQIGLYVNTLILRDRLGRSDSFLDLLDGVKRTVTEALEHQVYPFDKLVSELNLERDVSRSPLFDVSINLNSLDLQPAALQLDGVAVSHFDYPFAMAKVDLSFDFTETPAGLQLSLIYSTALYTEERAANLARHFEQLVASCVRAADRPIGRLDLLTRTEKRHLVHAVNATASEYPQDKTIVELFEEQVLNTPWRPALTFEGEEITYAHLNQRANRLAHYLQSRGVGPEVQVGVFLDRSPELIVALLGILKAGGAYVPLETTLPLKRLAALVNGSLLPVIVTQSALEDKLPSFMGSTLALDSDQDELRQESTENPVRKPSPENAAYVIYTSGSTGEPKGVVVEHRGLCNLAEAQLDLFQMHPGDRVLQFASPSFDASIFEISMALRAGATLCLGARDALLPGEPLLRFLSDERISIVTLPPSALAVLPPGDLPHLRTIIVAGEACAPELPLLWGSGRRFFNLYGPTEATIWSTEVLYDSEKRPPSIGKLIANVRIYLLDAGLELVPQGIPGEIYIGGVGVARGYLNKSDLTAEKFMPDPFSETPGSRLYGTGDIGRRLADGSIEFLGRADNQVKLRGYRIELGEIEAAIQRHPHVSGAVVVHREGSAGLKRLVAYVKPARDSVDAQELRSWLQNQLPEYMVPAQICTISDFSLTPAGKIDRKALPDPDAVTAPDATFIAPQTDLELILCRLFTEVLRRERVGMTDNFFELGGHSLLATQVVSRLRESFRVEVPLSRFFQNSTVGQLAGLLQSIEPNADKIARALGKLRTMSDEQKQQLRAQKMPVQR